MSGSLAMTIDPEHCGRSSGASRKGVGKFLKSTPEQGCQIFLGMKIYQNTVKICQTAKNYTK
jgi:hypothetical protein